LFVDPDPKQMNAAHQVQADSIEINTGLYTELKDSKAIENELVKIQQMAKYASDLGLHVYAGHGLNPQNVIAVSAIPEIEELNIGHNIIARSVYVGMEKAVKEMQAAIERGIRLRKN